MGALILCPITSVQARPADEIIVTGEKFARPLQATTSSVTLGREPINGIPRAALI